MKCVLQVLSLLSNYNSFHIYRWERLFIAGYDSGIVH